MIDPTDRERTARSLKDALRRVRNAEAERSDIVVELRDAERARLELLADELKAVFAEVPVENDSFVFKVAGGTPPRLWIDMTSFVAMGRDRRTYRFLKDTRLGRTVIVETANLDDVADCVTHYIAERIIERERSLEGDWLNRRLRRGEALPARNPVTSAGDVRGRGWAAWLLAAFLLGILFGGGLLLGVAWLRV